MLAVLLRHAGKVVTHAQLLREVWGSANAGNPQDLRVYAGQLRQKLEDDPAAPPPDPDGARHRRSPRLTRRQSRLASAGVGQQVAGRPSFSSALPIERRVLKPASPSVPPTS